MALTIGTQFGSHEIISLLGKGGMGEVYRARDTKLKRDVAIKILPDEFSSDPERVSRFQREAEVLASLNHPNIATIYDVQEINDTRFLILELVEGETLAERIERGPIPIEEALEIAKQICEAVEAAHERGIIHRDLKPANVKITPDGKVKVLDFGLAKAMSGANASPVGRSNQVMETAPATAALSNSPTLISGTIGGMIVGTAAYMSPEQARGRTADQRSDVFAFGCVLYEMLTGRQAFQGEDVSDVLASVIKGDVNLSLVPNNLNPRLKDLLHRCLAKDRKQRWQAIGDVRVELQQIVSDPRGSSLSAPHGFERQTLWKRAIPIFITALVVAAATFVITSTRFHSTAAPIVTRFPIVIPEAQRFNGSSIRPVVAISPTGTDIVYVADNQLYLRKMGEMDSRPIQGTSNALGPFFSPDGRWLAFHSNSDERIRKVAITGGATVTVSDVRVPLGSSWNQGDQILIGAGAEGVLRVSANGGKPERVIPVSAGEEAQSPQLLPDGENVLFTLVQGGQNFERWTKAQIVVQSLKTGRRQVLIEGGADARYVPTGHIIYGFGSDILAVPFETKTLHVAGGPVPVLEGIARSGVTGFTQMSFSENGTMVYVPGTNFNVSGRSLVLVERTGQMKSLSMAAAAYFHPRISPNGKQLVVGIEDKDVAIWISDLDGSTATRRLTFGSADRFPLWSPDGKHVAFQSDREKDLGLYWQLADGSGAAERLTTASGKGAEHTPQSFLPDGKTLIFSITNGTEGSLWSIDVAPGSKPKLLIDRTVGSQPAANLSSDGHWIAYTANDGDKRNIYVQPVPPTGAKYQVTTDGGISPIWSPDGRQLIYSQNPGSGIGNLMLVDVQTRPSFVLGKPTPLPVKGFFHNGAAGRPRGFDMSPDGKKFIVMVSPNEANSNARPTLQINVILNWFEELKQKVPVH